MKILLHAGVTSLLCFRRHLVLDAFGCVCSKNTRTQKSITATSIILIILPVATSSINPNPGDWSDESLGTTSTGNLVANPVPGNEVIEKGDKHRRIIGLFCFLINIQSITVWRYRSSNTTLGSSEPDFMFPSTAIPLSCMRGERCIMLRYGTN